jgi:hypothetical protein
MHSALHDKLSDPISFQACTLVFTKPLCEKLSQTAKTMLLRALIATAGLWIFAMTAAMGYVTFSM